MALYKTYAMLRYGCKIDVCVKNIYTNKTLLKSGIITNIDFT